MSRPLACMVVFASSPVDVPNVVATPELSQCHNEPSLAHVKRCDGWDG